MPVTTVATRLRAARSKCKLTLRGLAEISGVSNAYISQVESGLVLAVSVEIVEKLATAMKIDACWLAFGKKGKK